MGTGYEKCAKYKYYLDATSFEMFCQNVVKHAFKNEIANKIMETQIPGSKTK